MCSRLMRLHIFVLGTIFVGSVWSPGPASHVTATRGAMTTAIHQNADPVPKRLESEALASYETTWVGSQIDIGLSPTNFAVSCATPSLCIAVDSSGSTFTYAGSGWSKGVLLTSSQTGMLGDISCPSPSFCVATGTSFGGSGIAFIRSDGSWSGPIPTHSGILSISCPEAGICVGVDALSGHVVNYSHERWSLGPRLASDADLGPIACPKVGFCITQDDGYPWRYQNGKWSRGKRLEVVSPTRAFSAIACAVPDFCIAAGSGDAFTYSTGQWSKGHPLGGFVYNRRVAIRAISCASMSFCVALDNVGEELTYVNGRWSAGQEVDPGSLLDTISCPAPRRCVAVDEAGYAVSTLQERSSTSGRHG
jgi:hypothetical protein